MPFVLFGLHRYFATGRLRPLAGAAAAWLAQNLSCGYYLLFFSADRRALHRVGADDDGGLWRDTRALARVAGAIVAVFAATAPFLLPYLELRRLGFSPRSLDRNAALLRRRLRVLHRRSEPAPVGIDRARVAEIGRPAVSGTDDRRARGDRRRAWQLAPSTRRREGDATVGCYVSSTVADAVARVVIALLLGFSIRLPGLKITSLSRALAIVARSRRQSRLAVSRDARDGARRWLAVAGRHLLGDHAVRGRDVVRPGHSREGTHRRRPRTCTRCSTTSCPASTASACRRASR